MTISPLPQARLIFGLKSLTVEDTKPWLALEQQVEQYVHDINSGKRPRDRNGIRAGYVNMRRERVESGRGDA